MKNNSIGSNVQLNRGLSDLNIRMAGSNDIHKVRRRPKFRDGELDDGKPHKSRLGRHEGEEGVTSVEPDVSEVRRIRLERLEGNSTNRSTRNSATTEKMPVESSATVDATKSTSSHRRRRHHTLEDGAGHRSRSKTADREEKSRSDYVYAAPREKDSKNKPRGVTITERRRRDEEDESSSDSEDEEESPLEPMVPKSKKKTKVVVLEQPKRSSSTRRPKKEDKDKSTTKSPVDAGTSGSKSTSRRPKVTTGDSVSRPPLSRYEFCLCACYTTVLY